MCVFACVCVCVCVCVCLGEMKGNGGKERVCVAVCKEGVSVGK